MRAPAFWWREPGWAAMLLEPFAAAYQAIADRRMRSPGANAGIPVLCIGDLTVGGAGKTPTALAAAQLLAAAGERPMFLTRGYGGRLAGPLMVDAARHRACDVGDEPLLLARAFPTMIARDRPAGAQALRELGASVVVMDDGFHNPALNKDCAILVVDAVRGIGNGRVFPAGPLRASVQAQLERAHAIVVVGEGEAKLPSLQGASARQLPVFRAKLDPESAGHDFPRPVLAFAGIGNPEKFFATLSSLRIEVRTTRSFPDHHRYSPSDAQSLIEAAERGGLDLVTTEKDAVRMQGEPHLAALRERARTLPARLVMDTDDEREFVSLLFRKLRIAVSTASGPGGSGKAPLQG